MNSKVIFHTGFEYTLLSKKLYDFLVNKIFVNYIKKDICRVVPTPFEALFCPNIDKINIDFDIQFTFNDMIIKIPFRQFMIKNKNIIPVYPIGRFQGDIVIGTPFISQFNYTVFDYDNKQIEFYADNSMVNITSLDNMFNTNKIILSIESFIIILNCLLLIYLKLKE